MNLNGDMDKSYIGIDVAKRKLDCVIMRHGKFKSKVFPNQADGFQALHQWLLAYEVCTNQAHLCLEATGPYSEQVALALVSLGWQVSVVNPARIKGFAQSELARNKTDKSDAALLARFCMALQPSLWVPPSPAYRQLRALVERRQALQDMHQQEMNRLEAHQASGEVLVIGHVQQHIDWLNAQITQIEKDIDDHIDGHPELKQDAELMATIPGLGHVTIAKVLAYAGDVRRFTNGKALAAYVGITPKQRESGSSVKGRTMIARTGHAALRKAPYMPGMVALRHNPALKVFGERMRSNGLAPKAVIGAVMRKLVHLIYGVIKSGKPFDAEIPLKGLAIQDGI
ncbi:IS110 family transposase [Methylophilus aquaticus]|uniref:IS110 family transposase n=1 Tax=Methylophilus aquaticus TaxID=1971610 RepID=A0ABT9JQU8_9PROT|nr:IS110 family transposase [Methylophilus aquaticus]MDP8566922.1 IS110 family transposase [Methylophilus aquaticus]